MSTILPKQPPTDLQHNQTHPPIDESFRIELIRKAIHLTSITIPIVYFFTPRSLALGVLIPLTLCFFIVDISRYYSRPLEGWFNRTFGWLLRKHEYGTEHKRLNGATYVLLAGTIAVFVFPKLIAVTSFSILILCDLTAALIGKRFGKHRLFNKSVEGTIAFLLTGILIIFLLPKIEYSPWEYVVSSVAVVCGAFVEALPIDVDDNLSIPLTVGGIMWAGYAVFLPFLNLNKF